MKATVYSVLLVCTVVAGMPARAEHHSDTPRAKVIYGLAEEVFIPELGIRLPAKIDTGAESASLSATNIGRFEREGEKWVRFDLAVDGLQKESIELPLSHNVRIRRRASDYDESEEKHYARRPVVELTLCIGDRRARVDVNLADRRNFSQPVLIGFEGLQALDAMVDPDVKFAIGRPRCKGAKDALEPGDEQEQDNQEEQD